jgi:hypothetical protein
MMFSAAEEQTLRRLARIFANNKPLVAATPPFELRAINGGSANSLFINPSYLNSADDGLDDEGEDEAGFTEYCQELATVSGTPVVVNIKRRVTWPDRSVRCITIDECCLPTWWCVENEWIESAQACCAAPPGVKIARLVLLSFTVVSGTLTLDDLGLPSGIYLVNESGTLVWSGTETNGSTWQLGQNLVTGGLTWACDGANLEVSVDISGFSGGTDTVSTCTLTASPLSLGNWTFERTLTTTCKNSGATYETVQTATIELEVSSWLDGADPATGVQSITEGIAPPWDAGGPWKTEDEAINCCGEMVTELDAAMDESCPTLCSYSLRRYFKLVLKNVTGGLVATETGQIDAFTVLSTPNATPPTPCGRAGTVTTSGSTATPNETPGITLGLLIYPDPPHPSATAMKLRVTAALSLTPGSWVDAQPVGTWTVPGTFPISYNRASAGGAPVPSTKSITFTKELCSVTGFVQSAEKIADVTTCGFSTLWGAGSNFDVGTGELWVEPV